MEVSRSLSAITPSLPRFHSLLTTDFLARNFVSTCKNSYRTGKCKKKLVFQVYPPPRKRRLLNVTSGLDTQSVIIIVGLSVATFSAFVAFFSFNHNRRRKLDNVQPSREKDRDGVGTLEMTKQNEKYLKKTIDVEETNEDMPSVQRELVPEKITGNGHVFKEKEVQYQKNESVSKKALVGVALESTSSESISSCDTSSILPHEVYDQWPGVITEPVSSPSMMHDTLQEVNQDSAIKNGENGIQVSDDNYVVNQSAREDNRQIPTDKDHHGIKTLEITKQSECCSKKNTEIGETNEVKPLEYIEPIPQKINENEHLCKEREVRYLKNELSNKQTPTDIASASTGSDTHSCDGSSSLPHLDFDHRPELVIKPASSTYISQSSREELYTFYNKNKAPMSSSQQVEGLKAVSSHPVVHKEELPSSTLANMLHKTKLPVEVSHCASVYVKEKESHECYKEGFSRKRKDFGKDEVLEADVVQKTQRSWSKISHTNKSPAGSKRDESEYYRNYNLMLKDGRLTDCIELLNVMEQQGLLDMNKIYHVKFFNACKSRKAVKEAFRFTKLVDNPTLSTFNMLLTVCASSQYSEGAFEVLQLVKEAKLKADCKLYTTVISACAKSGKVDAMFEVFHEMVNAGVEPNLHTYGALIDGCARAGQVAKAFGAYGILRSKNVKPDRVVFNALITACGKSGAVDRAFDVLAEMATEPTPVDPDHVTIGALIKTCVQANQYDRALEVYKMIHKYKIKGTPEVYTIAVNSCSQMGDLEFALTVYNDMIRNGVLPDELFLSALIDVAGHAGKIDVAFEVLQEARTRGTKLGIISHSSLMGACKNAKNWQKAVDLYEDLKAVNLRPTVSTMNALITALCHGNQLQKAVEVLTEMRSSGLRPNTITYSILLTTSEKKDELQLGCFLYLQAKKDRVVLNLAMYRSLIRMCLRRVEKAYSLGEKVISFNSGKPQLDNEWTLLALKVYREAIVARAVLSMEVFSLVLACLQFPHDTSSRSRLVEEVGVTADASSANLFSMIDGFGEYDSRSFSLLEEAASLGVVPCVSLEESPIIVDTRELEIHTAEVYLLTVLKGLKHRLAAGTKLPTVNVLLPVENKDILIPLGVRPVKLAGRVGQAIGSLLRRLGLQYEGNESYGKIRIKGISMKRWLEPELDPPFSGKPTGLNSSKIRLGKGIADQQRNIRTSNYSLD